MTILGGILPHFANFVAWPYKSGRIYRGSCKVGRKIGVPAEDAETTEKRAQYLGLGFIFRVFPRLPRAISYTFSKINSLGGDFARAVLNLSVYPKRSFPVKAQNRILLPKIKNAVIIYPDQDHSVADDVENG